MPESRPTSRWYHITPDRLIIGLLAIEVFLFLSEWFQWFAFNEKKGYTVLIAVAAVCSVVALMLLWLVVSLLFRWRFQFSLRSLVVLVVAVAVPLGWFGVKLREAERQRRAVAAVTRADGWVGYDYQSTEIGRLEVSAEPPFPAWLRALIGHDFLSDVTSVGFVGSIEVDDVTLQHLKGLTELEWLWVVSTHVTDEDIKELLKALPNCEIHCPIPPTPETNLDRP